MPEGQQQNGRDQHRDEVEFPARSLLKMLWVLTVAISVYALSIGAKIWTLKTLPSGAEGGFVSVIAAIFGILITGVFVFMTFRIDRGARIEARATAEKEVERRLGNVEKDAVAAARRVLSAELAETKNASERFSVTIANKLRTETEAVLERRNNNLVHEIRPLTQEDGWAS